MRLLIAKCNVTYEGRLGAHLPDAIRLVMMKADGSVAVHSDSKAYKPLNWMTPPCHVEEDLEGGAGTLTVSNAKGEHLRIEIAQILEDRSVAFGDEPGLEKDGVEAELQKLLADQLDKLEDGLTLVRREFSTDIGPVDILCRGRDGEAVAVEIKRIGELAGVEQLSRYLERLDCDPMLKPVRGIYAACVVKPQARVLAESRGIAWREIDLEELRESQGASLKLF